MKKIATLTSFLFLTAYAVSAQSRCQKGTWVFGINPLSYSFFNNSKSTLSIRDTLVNINTYKSNGISIGYNMGAGYFIRDNFCIGSGFGGLGSLSFSPALSVNLFARYYLMQKKRCFSFTKQDNSRRYAFFIQGMILGGYYSVNSEANSYSPSGNYSSLTKSKGYSYTYGAQAALGYTYVLAKHVAFELISIYGNTSYTSVGTGSRDGVVIPSAKNVSHNNGLSLLFGIQTYF